MKIHCKCTQEYKKNSGVEENIPLTKDILKQIRDHVFHYFIKATKVGESRLRCRKNNKIWTQEEKDSMAALLFRRMPKENACLIDIYTASFIFSKACLYGYSPKESCFAPRMCPLFLKIPQRDLLTRQSLTFVWITLCVFPCHLFIYSFWYKKTVILKT